MAKHSNHPLTSARDGLVDSYNDVPYTSAPDAARHPDRLATIGTLLGLDVAPVATCRVLEFACGDGSNLVSIASSLPDATFVGFDFATTPIARARAMARSLGASNVQLLECDLRELPMDLGHFDYVIAHGLYSWVPGEVQRHVLPLIARHLAPNGVAFVSYNTLPGCRMRSIVWDMLRYHTRAGAAKHDKLAAARALLDLVAAPVADDNAIQQAMRIEVRNAAQSSDASLAHDDLSEYNSAVHFHEFAGEAAHAGLVYVHEARPAATSAANVAPHVRSALAGLDHLEREQYLDFVLFRHFRESLLCHADALSGFTMIPSRASALFALPSLELRRVAGANAAMPNVDAGRARILRRLFDAWPQSVPVAAIDACDAQATAVRTSAACANDTEALVVELFRAGLVDLRTLPARVASAAGERPRAFAAARFLATEHEVIPSVHHDALRYRDPLGRRLLALLDGTRTREALVAELGGPFAGPGGVAKLDGALAVLARKALLVA